jgi:hypothetical protein
MKVSCTLTASYKARLSSASRGYRGFHRSASGPHTGLRRAGRHLRSCYRLPFVRCWTTSPVSEVPKHCGCMKMPSTAPPNHPSIIVQRAVEFGSGKNATAALRVLSLRYCGPSVTKLPFGDRHRLIDLDGLATGRCPGAFLCFVERRSQIARDQSFGGIVAKVCIHRTRLDGGRAWHKELRAVASCYPSQDGSKPLIGASEPSPSAYPHVVQATGSSGEA